MHLHISFLAKHQDYNFFLNNQGNSTRGKKSPKRVPTHPIDKAAAEWAKEASASPSPRPIPAKNSKENTGGKEWTRKDFDMCDLFFKFFVFFSFVDVANEAPKDGRFLGWEQKRLSGLPNNHASYWDDSDDEPSEEDEDDIFSVRNPPVRTLQSASRLNRMLAHSILSNNDGLSDLLF